MSEAERELYGAVEEYIRSTYNQAAAAEKAAVGFVMTTYRRRLPSSARSPAKSARTSTRCSPGSPDAHPTASSNG